ncbi:MAG: carbohydrate ABC transporter substrate-binding protein [Gammaproteobacteria bacterium]|nr:carbohydrate ABC transporter substrate-binding protein [Gammaproteobacteria bacterium]
MKKTFIALAIGSVLMPLGAQSAELTIESWRNDDLKIWQDTIIPAFEAKHPDIKVKFAPTAPVEYDASLNAKLEGGTAGDLITCRPFDRALALYDKGYLAAVDDLEGMKNFGDVAKSGWVTDDGSAHFCVPMASVIHGFMYNKEAFAEVGVEVPTTSAEFYAALDKFKEDGNYIPMAMGTNDQWEAATMGYTNVGPNFWNGEEGRQGLINGTAKLTDAPFVAAMEEMAKWSGYLGDGYQAQTYPDSQNLFTLGRAAIYPTGSWEINGFNDGADFEYGAFKPPVQNSGDQCHISDHVDIAMGMNKSTKNPEAARTFLEWVASAEFASLYANALPGFFSLSNHDVTLSDPVAQQMVSWRGECGTTIRVADQILSRGTPSLSTELWGASARVINGTASAAEVMGELQTQLDSWYKK